MDETTLLAALRRHWEYEGTDYEMSHEIYHDDALIDYPQSGERIVGRRTLQACAVTTRTNRVASPSGASSGAAICGSPST